MCHPAPCTRCGKTTWSGCGNHAAAVMSAIPAAKRCTCENRPAPGGFLRTLFRR